MRPVKRGFVLCLILLTAAFLLASFLGRRQEISEYENRYLAAHPEFSGESLLDGSYFRGWDDYFADHVAFRDNMMRDWLWLRLNAKKQVLVNDVMISREALLPYLGEKDFGSDDYDRLAREAVARLEPVRQAVENRGGPVPVLWRRRPVCSLPGGLSRLPPHPCRLLRKLRGGLPYRPGGGWLLRALFPRCVCGGGGQSQALLLHRGSPLQLPWGISELPGHLRVVQ